MSWLSGIFNWITGKPKFPDIPPNIFFEKDVTSDNDFWVIFILYTYSSTALCTGCVRKIYLLILYSYIQISCILNPMLEIKYIDGIVTALLDTDKCLINGLYQYQPKTNKEISMFTNIEVNTGVRVSLYRKKGSNAAWKVASCYLSKNGPRHQAMKYIIRMVLVNRLHFNLFVFLDLIPVKRSTYISVIMNLLLKLIKVMKITKII